ncbi:hypothetical protein BVY03_01775 [bacterium K02(2017)]|nr:hypothetical protein BVY03_01775 [bacterium K02(2017)]
MKFHLSLLLFVTLIAGSQMAQAQPQIVVDPSSNSIQQPKRQKFFLTSYGEMHYNNIDNSNDRLELHRFVIGINYDFSDRIHFRSEVEFEHGFTEQYVEMFYLDFEVKSWINFRVGSIILPIGYINTNHEPTTFHSVERPDVYVRIIPTSWMEGGVGIWGTIVDGLTYELYGHTSLNYNDGFDTDTGFSGSSGLRGGRGKVAGAEMNDFAFTGRLQYTGVKGLRLGSSGFFGFTDHGDTRVSGGMVALIEADAKYSFSGIEIEGLVAAVFNPDAGEMTLAQRADGNIGATDVIGQRMLGYIFEMGYHVFQHIWEEAPSDLVVFVRYEKFDTHNKVPTGFTKNQAYNRQNVTFGLAFYPMSQVVLKADYSWKDNGLNTANSQFNLAAGYSF